MLREFPTRLASAFFMWPMRPVDLDDELGIFQAVKDSPGRIQWQGVSMATTDQTERRLPKTLTWKGEKPMPIKKSVLAVVIAIAITAIYITAAARPVGQNQSVHEPGSMQRQVSLPPSGAPTEPQVPASGPAAPIISADPADGGVSNSSPPPAHPVTSPMPASSAPSVSLVAFDDEDPGTNYDPGFSCSNGFDNEQRFAIVSGKSDSFPTWGTSEDSRHVKTLRKRIPGDFIWFQRDEKSYIIRDQATVDRARHLWEPQEELGKKQAELGKQQEALGKQQEELSAPMQKVRVNVPDITPELDKLKAQLQQLGPEASVTRIAEIQSQLGALQACIGELQANAGSEQGNFGAETRALGAEQGKLGEQQRELGRQQAKLARKAERAMEELLDDAIKKGLAQPEEPGSALF